MTSDPIKAVRSSLVGGAVLVIVTLGAVGVLVGSAVRESNEQAQAAAFDALLAVQHDSCLGGARAIRQLNVNAGIIREVLLFAAASAPTSRQRQTYLEAGRRAQVLRVPDCDVQRRRAQRIIDRVSP